MDGFFNEEIKNEERDPEVNVSSDADDNFQTQSADFDNEYSTVYNPIEYLEPEPQKDLKPMSKGLKIFALIMAAVILVTGGALAGYIASSGKGNYTNG